MRIRMITTLSGERDVFLKDKEVDLEDTEAQSFIKAGIAVQVESTARKPGRPPVNEPSGK